MMSEEENNDEYLINTYKLATKMASALRTKSKELLPIVKFKKKGESFYYSLSDKRHVLVNRQEEWYFVPFVPRDDKDRICLYSPYLFAMAVFIMVPEDEIEIIGFN